MIHPKLALMIVLCLSLIVPAAATADSDAAFLLSLAQDISRESPLTGVGTPAPTPKECSISRSCGDGNTVACTGTSSCVYSPMGVQCGTTQVSCPAACRMDFQCGACGYYSCISLKGDCGITGEGCNGHPQVCPSGC